MNEEKEIKPTSIRLDPEVREKLIELAQKERRSISKEIEHIIMKYLQFKEE